MRILFLLLLTLGLQATPSAYGQELTLSLDNAPLERAFKEIEKQTGYSFVYTRAQLHNTRPVSCRMRAVPLESVLTACFKGQPLTYVIENRYIIIRRRLDPAEGNDSLLTDSLFMVSGVIMDEKNRPLYGATIMAQLNERSTSSDVNGQFTLMLRKRPDQLLITCIGYARKKIEIPETGKIIVRLEPSSQSLDEAVVMAYGQTNRRLNTGNIGKVTSRQIGSQPLTNPIGTLQGLVPGIFITQGNGLPGSNFSVLINGRNSLRNGTEPLYVLDGVPMVNEELSQRGGSFNANNPLHSLNPLDIESIEILKGPDATSIYGSRGANGVVLITTRMGKAEKTELQLQAYQGWSRAGKIDKYLTTAEYLTMRKEAFSNDGKTATAANAPDLLRWDTTRYTDLPQQLLGHTASSTNWQMRISGGNHFTNFTVSSNYSRENTIFPGHFRNQRHTLSASLRHQSASKKFNFTFRAGYGNDNSLFPNPGLVNGITLPPNVPAFYDSAGRLNWSENGAFFSNPMASLLQTYEGNNERLSANALLSYQISKSFTLKSGLGYTSLLFTENSFTPIRSQNPAYNPKGTSNFGNSRIRSWIAEPQLEYNAIPGGHFRLNALLGVTIQQNRNENEIITGYGYTNDALLGSVAAAPNISVSNGGSRYKYAAFFSRVNLNWQNQLILNLSARNDGSSRFGPGHQYARFGSVGTAWIFSENRILKNSLWLSFGKLRAGYGTAGNDQIGDYRYLDAWSNTTYGYQSLPSLYPTSLFNSDYSWERSRKLEIGLDLAFFHEKLQLSVNWYKSKSDNQLIAYSLPGQTGFTGILRNFPGTVQNKSLELELRTTPWKRGTFSWQANINITFPSNRLLSFPDLENSSYAYTYMVGEPVNAFIGYHYLGIDPAEGVYTFADLNHDGLLNQKDYAYLGTTDPQYYGGLENVIVSGRFAISFLITWVRQNGIHPVWGTYNAVGSQRNMRREVLDRWMKPGDQEIEYQKYTQQFGTPASSAALQIYKSDAALTDASFIRLKNISLEYNLPTPILARLRLSGGNVFVRAHNILTLTKYPGTDPEAQKGLIPILKTFVTGFSLTL